MSEGTGAARTWVEIPQGSPFPVQNLPYGVFSYAGDPPRVGVAIGDHVLDLAPVAAEEGLAGAEVFEEPSLAPFMALGPSAWRSVREWLLELLTAEAFRDLVEPHLMARSEVTMHLPCAIGDYVDFYSSEHHASNVGALFRPGQPPLTPNWKHLPIGYHGRSGSVVLSGTEVIRPCGQRKAAGDAAPTYGPSERLDIEAEVGFLVGVPTALGQRVAVRDFAEHVFGAVLVNDWSARDLQAWEYVPLGPFLGKSFATSISAWVVPLLALQAARVEPPARDTELLSYLQDDEPWGLDLQLEVSWNGTVVSRPPFAGLYWTAAQQLAHLSVNGASVRTGDLYASGTVSGSQADQRGSFLELSWGGQTPVRLAGGSTRVFLEDGDTVAIRAWAPGEGGVPIGFGEVEGTVRPAID